MMTKIEFNPENWVDETATLIADDAAMTIEIKGETLFLDQQPPIFEATDAKPDWDFHCYHLMLRGEKVASLTRFGKDAQWELLGAGIDRQNANPFILAGLWAANCL